MEALKYLKTARFSGADAESFLQAQLSADIAALKPGDSTFACYCSPRGQVYGLLLVCRTERDYLVIGAAELLPAMLQRLRMFVFRTRVQFELDEALVIYGVQRHEPSMKNRLFSPGDFGLHYLVTDSDLKAQESVPGFRAQEISAQVVWLDSATTEKFIPQMLGFDQLGAVSFTKGCYPGQEIVARARYLGKVKRKPLVLVVEQPVSIEAAQRIELARGDQWLKGTIVDAVSEQDSRTYLFVIAPAEPDDPVSQIRFGQQVYRCATT